MKSQQEKDNEEYINDPRAKGAKWVLNVCDTFSYEHYPVYIKTKKELEKAKVRYNQNMQQIFSIIELKPKKK